MTPQEIEELIETRFNERLKKIEDTLQEMSSILAKIQGASILLRGLFYVVAPVVAGVVWLKDHIKL